MMKLAPILLLWASVAFASPVATMPKVGGLYFTRQIVATASAAQSLTITNNQAVALTFNSFAAPADFTAVSADCTVLAPGASCSVQVAFLPQTVATFYEYLTIFESAGTLSVPLQGTSIAPDPGPEAIVTPYNPCVAPGGSYQFSVMGAQAAFDWRVDGISGGNAAVGTITQAGLYAASSGSHAITASAPGEIPIGSTVKITSAPYFAIYPYVSNLPVGATQTFQPQICGVPDTSPVTYTVDGIVGGNAAVGTVTSAGLYTFPATGHHTVRVVDGAHGSGAVATVLASITGDFDNHSGLLPVPASLFGAGRGEAMHNAADRMILSNAGITVSRLYAQIPVVYKTTTPDWTRLDPFLAAIRDAGQTAMLQVSQSPPWLAGPCGVYSAPNDVGAWAQMAAAYVAHIDAVFPGVVADYEIWNEPDTGGMCGVTDRLATYQVIYAAAAAAMKAQAASDGVTIRVGGPALAGQNAAWLAAMISNPSTQPYLDFWSYHDYMLGSGQLASTWDTYNGLPTLFQRTQDPSLGIAAQYAKAALAPIPVYLTEFNTNWEFFKDCCRNDPTYGPLWNSLAISDLLDTVYSGSQTPSKLIYFASNAAPYMCLVGVLDAGMDCNYSIGSTPAAYPPYYALELYAGTLGLGQGGWMAKSISPAAGSGGLVATAFYNSGQDSIVITNPTPGSYTMPVVFLNTGLVNPAATLYQAGASGITASALALNANTVTVSIPGYSVEAVALVGHEGYRK